jgi:hypothetical protein
MSIPAVPPPGEGQKMPNPLLLQGEMPMGKPAPMNSPAVKWMMQLFHNVDPGTLSRYAEPLYRNMLQMLSNAVEYAKRKSHEAAQRMKKVIQGEE